MNEFSFEIKRLLKFSSFVVVVLGVFLLFAALNSFKEWHASNQAYNSISVTGTGESVTVPDIAVFSFSVSADAKTVTDAQNQVTSKSNDVLDALKGMDIEEKDIKTIDYSVNPKYSYTNSVCSSTGICPPGRQILDGYTVTNSVQVKVRKTDDAGKALALVGEKGATNISSLSFTTDDPYQAVNDAKAKAIDDAREKAEAIADHLGVRIVRVVGYEENGGAYPMYASGGVTSAFNKAMDSVAPVPIQVGENKTTATVSVQYEIR
ncbi:MAG: SIMPL domain-containing protein [Patescibacteria group bacterium]